MAVLRSIVSSFVCDPGCLTCLGEGAVCEDHPDVPWAGTVGDERGCPCRGAGMPCRAENRGEFEPCPTCDGTGRLPTFDDDEAVPTERLTTTVVNLTIQGCSHPGMNPMTLADAYAGFPV
jgi:hypothetical protein